MDDQDYLVPGRECGACTACCVEPAITVEGFEKLPGVACPNCTEGRGCAIYDRRPQVCRNYHCLWRSLPNLSEDWRPDLSGIMMVLTDVPPGSPAEFAVDLILVGPAEVLDGAAFAGMVGGFVESGTAVFLNVSPGPGFLAYKALLNEMLAPAIAARDLAEVRARIRACHRKLSEQTPVPVTAGDISRSRMAEGWSAGAR